MLGKLLSTALAVLPLSMHTTAGAAEPQETNLAVARQFVTQALGEADAGAIDRLVADDVVVTTGLSPKEPIRGRAAYKQILAGFGDAWPVRQLVIDDIFASGDKVVVRFTATAVFRKDYYGVKANNLVVPLKEVHIYTVRDGRIVENLVAAVNLPYEFLMYPALKDAVLGDLKAAP